MRSKRFSRTTEKRIWLFKVGLALEDMGTVLLSDVSSDRRTVPMSFVLLLCLFYAIVKIFNEKH